MLTFHVAPMDLGMLFPFDSIDMPPRWGWLLASRPGFNGSAAGDAACPLSRWMLFHDGCSSVLRLLCHKADFSTNVRLALLWKLPRAPAAASGAKAACVAHAGVTEAAARGGRALVGRAAGGQGAVLVLVVAAVGSGGALEHALQDLLYLLRIGVLQ